MRSRLGIIFCISGVILLIDPSLDVISFLNRAVLICTQYWPVFLILFGLRLCQSSPTKKTNKHK